MSHSDRSKALFPDASDLAAAFLLESEKEARLRSEAAPDSFESEREAQEDPTNTVPDAETAPDMENRKYDDPTNILLKAEAPLDMENTKEMFSKVDRVDRSVMILPLDPSLLQMSDEEKVFLRAVISPDDAVIHQRIMQIQKE